MKPDMVWSVYAQINHMRLASINIRNFLLNSVHISGFSTIFLENGPILQEFSAFQITRWFFLNFYWLGLFHLSLFTHVTASFVQILLYAFIIYFSVDIHIHTPTLICRCLYFPIISKKTTKNYSYFLYLDWCRAQIQIGFTCSAPIFPIRSCMCISQF